MCIHSEGSDVIMKKRFLAGSIALAILTMSLAGCGAKKDSHEKKVKLDPNNPVSLTVWHYYNGTQQATFDELVEEFNKTVGKDEGIYVEGRSQGSVSDLEKAVSSALNEEVGANDLPDIFSSYADTAYTAQKKGKLTDLSKYFTKDELSKYVDSYIQEGYFNQDDSLYLLPVAKSTEIMMINKTDWEPFAKATGVQLDDLATIEGVVKVAEKYYEWTDAQTKDVKDDGKAFYGRDSMANYFIIGMKQMGKDIFEVKDGTVKFQTDKNLIHRLWENYYVPYMKGYFVAYGKFRSDDVKIGNILAYTGSTSSAFYFPDNVEKEDGSYPIDFIVRKAPIMEGGQDYKVQQGAGMAVTKSDEQHEYASCEFLKWFTKKEQNLQFVCQSAYLPVLKEANNLTSLDSIIKEKNIKMNKKAYSCLETVLDQFDDSKFYTTKNFENGFRARKVLDYNLSDQITEDKKAMDAAIKAGASREEEVKKYTSEKSFETWYQNFCKALSDSVK